MNVNVNEVLSNKENIYFGHGTGVHGDLLIDSIMLNGLRCSHGSLYNTSIPLGVGGFIPKETIDLLDSWPHLESKIIVIVSYPYKYKIIDTVGLRTYNQGDAAIYYIPSEENQAKYNLTNSPYVMPEFVMGYYDNNNKTFINNLKYYEHLPIEEQRILFDKVKENYFNILDNACGIDLYRNLLKNNKDIKYYFPFTDEEVNDFKRKKNESVILSNIDNKLLNKMVKSQNGREITFYEYLTKVVFPLFPPKDKVTLINGNTIPYTHFVIECVLYECQEKYNGDFISYINENVILDKENEVKPTRIL